MLKQLLALVGASAIGCAPVWAAPLKTVGLSKVMLDTESGEIKGKMKGGTLCVFPAKMTLPKEKKTEDYERYDNLFSARLKSDGYTVVSTSGDLFATESDKKADYLVGAVIRPDTVNLCSSVAGVKGDVTLLVDWQIFDRANGKVVETLTTSGSAASDKFSKTGFAPVWNEAFQANLGAFLAKGLLQKYTGAPATPVSPPQPASVATAPAKS